MGALIKSQECLRRMLSRVHALQNWGDNTFTESQLLARIYEDAIPDPADGSIHTLEYINSIRPFVVVGVDASNPITYKRDSMGGGGGVFAPEGSLLFFIEQNANGNSESEIDREFSALIDSMLFTGDSEEPGLLDLTGRDDSLWIKQAECTGVYRVAPEEIVSRGDAVRAYFSVRWGV